MANEITVQNSVLIRNGYFNLDFVPGKFQITQTALGQYNEINTIATTETSVVLTGSITAPRVCIVYNLDATNYCELGWTTADYGMKLFPASMPSIFELAPGKTTLYLKANTAATDVLIIACEA